MDTTLLEVRQLSVNAGDKKILRDIDLTINRGEVHVVMGPNGSGKSTLANVIMSNPKYSITEGEILFEGEDITDLPADERAKRGIFMSFQSPVEVSGISVANFIRAAKSAIEGKKISVVKFARELGETMEELDMKSEYVDRYLNYGFSGGEKKKNEILQMRMLNPKLAILDETDSGLDVDAVRIVADGIDRYRTSDNALLIITHHKEIVGRIKPDFVHVLIDGRLVKTSDASLMDEIEKRGYLWMKEEV
ncbi:Fe-S cluster assembly ATPase SufC [Filifactor villosus]|uniref:Fe-S cluster assembly ATPase SufC n=1 Tax=Filifactor villosus TaxID=29374 RepID=A0ABV9QHQ1_9FIRM